MIIVLASFRIKIFNHSYESIRPSTTNQPFENFTLREINAMKFLTIKYALVFLAFFYSIAIYAQNPPNWTHRQLMEPSKLADAILSKADVPVIINVGPGAIIPNSIDVGMCSKEEGLNKLKTQLSSLAKNQKIVIYCGCCPFEHCPNVRPAINVLKQMNFTNYFLLNLPHNIKIDWIDLGYPVKE